MNPNNVKTLVLNALSDTQLGQITLQLCDQRSEASWHRAGCPVPPPNIVKRKFIVRCAREARVRNFVETGTYHGDTVRYVLDDFERIFSIELSEHLAALARRRFSAHKHVSILLGDSGELIHEVLRNLSGPALFWLDGHYSEGETARGIQDTPILRELDAIFGDLPKANHLILVDDARLFGTDPAYPSLELVQRLASDAGYQSFELKHDIIHLSKS